MDMGNGILTPDVNDLMHEAAAVSNAMMTNSIAPVGQPAYSYSGSMMPQMYPSPGYVGSFVDNSILTHFSVSTENYLQLKEIKLTQIIFNTPSFY